MYIGELLAYNAQKVDCYEKTVNCDTEKIVEKENLYGKTLYPE